MMSLVLYFLPSPAFIFYIFTKIANAVLMYLHPPQLLGVTNFGSYLNVKNESQLTYRPVFRLETLSGVSSRGKLEHSYQ